MRALIGAMRAGNCPLDQHPIGYAASGFGASLTRSGKRHEGM